MTKDIINWTNGFITKSITTRKIFQITQPRRQIPNELLKYAQGACKSPRRLSQVKSDFTGSQNVHRNADMKEICREYVENKKSGKDMSKEGPVWRFSSKHSEQILRRSIAIKRRIPEENK